MKSSQHKKVTFAKASISISFQTEEEARAAYHSLLQESDFSHRGSSKLCLRRKSLIIKIEADDPVSLRASLNSYLRLIYLIKSVEENTNEN
ncbi:MAG: KEOPS complex subunit Pcc1 [Candidatus Micrarchaeota archaeon]|nr:KEOPS complex subunit Pcc1 [Candidatus Micrarchaeota archaeon]